MSQRGRGSISARSREWQLRADVLPLAEHAIRRGGHVRVGLEDDASDPSRGNVERVREIAALARRLGRPIATPADARRLTGG